MKVINLNNIEEIIDFKRQYEDGLSDDLKMDIASFVQKHCDISEYAYVFTYNDNQEVVPFKLEEFSGEKYIISAYDDESSTIVFNIVKDVIEKTDFNKLVKLSMQDVILLNQDFNTKDFAAFIKNGSYYIENFKGVDMSQFE